MICRVINLSYFLSKAPEADQHPTVVSLPLLDLLLDPQAVGTSQRWSHQFNIIFNTA